MVDLDAPSASASAAGFVSGLNILSRLLAGNVRDRLRKVVVILLPYNRAHGLRQPNILLRQMLF